MCASFKTITNGENQTAEFFASGVAMGSVSAFDSAAIPYLVRSTVDLVSDRFNQSINQSI